MARALIPLLAFLLMPFAAFAAEPVPAVAVYCEALLASGNSSGPGFGEDEWKALAERLAERRLLNPDAAMSPAVKACMEAHATEFQDAEFLLKGRALVVDAARELKAREARYEAEWRGFLDRVRPGAEALMTAELPADALR